MKLDLKIHNLQPAGRVGMFNLKAIIKSLTQSMKNVYMQYGDYFNDAILHKNLLYFLFMFASILLLCISLINLYMHYKFINILAIIILLLLLPIAANFTGIVIPGSVSYIVMQYQYVLIIPFFIGIAEHVHQKKQIVCLSKAVVYITCLLITWTYVISANATYTCYKLSYNHINFEASLVLGEIYELPNYVPSETTIVFAGFPNADELVEQVSSYKYAIHYTDNPVFWEDMNGASHNRWYYLMNYFGIDGKNLDSKMYENIIFSNEFKKMPIWPAAGSVKMINEMAIVKFTEHPPLP